MSGIYVRERIKLEYYKTKLPYPKRTDPDFREKRSAYQDDELRLGREFQSDLFAEYQVTNNPKAVRCYQLAWEYGQADGLNGVLDYFDELVELIKS